MQSTEPQIRVLLYSKNRPWQLHQLLRSIEMFIGWASLDVHILYAYDSKVGDQAYSDFQTIYDIELPKLYNQPNITFVKEADQKAEINLQVDEIILNNPHKYFMFMVDDMIFFDSININNIISQFENQKDCFSTHLKLSPDIQYSHTNDKFMKLPDDFLKLNLSEQVNDFTLKYKRSQTHYDWNYPFDFCGSLYKSEHVQKIYSKIKEIHPEKITRPNHFEYFGNKILQEHFAKLLEEFKCCICLNRPCMTVVTVNKVQDIYNTPVYEIETGQDQLLIKMNQMYMDKVNYNLEYYRRTQLESVHVGDFQLESKSHGEAEIVRVAILMPVYNTKVYQLNQAMASLETQVLRNVEMTTFIVDDGSQDAETLDSLKELQLKPGVQVLTKKENGGVAKALNFGLATILSDGGIKYVFRFDSDDICYPDRVQTQVDFMEQNPDVDFCGSSIEVFNDKNPNQYKMSICQTGEFLKYQSLLKCPFAHPTVVFRAARITNKLYDEQYALLEDYGLWLKLIHDDQFKYANLGQVLLKHRKHMGNTSKMNQKSKFENVMKEKYLSQLLGQEIAPDLVSEFILVTNRSLKGPLYQKVMANLKFKTELIGLFNQLKEHFQESITQKHVKEQICQDIEARKSELALHEIQADGDSVAMVKMLMANGQLANVLKNM